MMTPDIDISIVNRAALVVHAIVPIELTAAEKRIARGLAGARPNITVVVVDAGRIRAPHIVGTAAHYITESGNICWSPNAYRRAHGRPTYVASTLRVEVHAVWVSRRRAKAVAS